MKPLNVVLFHDFETLDAMGPAEVLGGIGIWTADCYSSEGGTVTSRQGIRFDTRPFREMDDSGVLLIPGGFGVRALVTAEDYVARIAGFSCRAEFVLTVCTGSALLAATGHLDGREATTNKIAFDWVVSVRPEVRWQRCARWAVDGRFYTSSGVTAGIDMALAFLADRRGRDAALERAHRIEHVWSQKREDDPFAGP